MDRKVCVDLMWLPQMIAQLHATNRELEKELQKLQGGKKGTTIRQDVPHSPPPPPPLLPAWPQQLAPVLSGVMGGVATADPELADLPRDKTSVAKRPRPAVSADDVDPGSHSKKAKAHARCEHGKEKRRCKECGGSGICKHQHLKFTCKLCNPVGTGGICIHNRDKYNCVQCKGGGICEHNRRRARCVECGGGSICEHKRQRRICKECKGADICPHNRIKQYCVECGGGSICQHRRVRRNCKECAAPKEHCLPQELAQAPAAPNLGPDNALAVQHTTGAASTVIPSGLSLMPPSSLPASLASVK